MVETKFWRSLPDGRAQCLVCPHQCTLKEGQRGICFVRANESGKIVLTTYGRSSGFCVDPIEKKPLNHFLPGTPILSFGTAGCNLKCSFCQNWHLSRSREMETVAEEASPEAIARAAAALRCRSVAFTYNDPVVFLEYAIDTAIACHRHSIKTVAVTAGYMNPEACAEFYRHLDAANVDLKGFSDDFYKKLCGGHLQPVLDTLIYLKKETHVWFELTTLLIPGENDSEKELEDMTRWVARELGPDVPMHFTAFYPAWHLTEKPPTSPATLKKARRIAMKNGIRYAFTGNICDEEGATTYCHHCGKVLVGRNGYDITAWNLSASGACTSCNTPCAGVFEEEPGKWGAKCLQVSVGRQ